MALKLVPTSQFKKDCKRARKRGFNMADLQAALDSLCAKNPLEERHRDHSLSGDYHGFRECHIQPDWLLLYAIDEEKSILVAARTGTHSDLFDE